MKKRQSEKNSESRKYLWLTLTGTILLLVGAACIAVKAQTGEYLDAHGVLHENFFLLPVGFVLMTAGAVIIAAAGIRMMIRKRKK